MCDSLSALDHEFWPPLPLSTLRSATYNRVSSYTEKKEPYPNASYAPLYSHKILGWLLLAPELKPD